jgi:hypothetical protein
MQILFEHAATPGVAYDECLIYGYGDGFGGVLNEMDLHETVDSAGLKFVKFRGKFQEANAINKNKRMYPFDVLNGNVKSLEEALKYGLCGELDHPTDSIIHFTNASHKVTKLWWDGNTLMGEGTILNTPSGKILKALINDGVRVGISSRGVGNGKVNEDGVLVIGESYKLITFDAVADPSTHAAFQEKVVSTKRESVISSRILPEITSKIEGSSINKSTISKELVLACVGGIIQKQASELKARLK